MASAYGTTADATAYFTERGGVSAYPEWFAADDPGKATAMIVGSEWLDLEYEASMQGRRTADGQALAFPREGVVVYGYPVSSTTVPDRVKHASWEAAFRYLQGLPLLPDSPDRSTGGEIVREEKAAGSVRKAVEYQPRTQTNLRRYPRIEALMQPVLRGGGGSVDVRVQL